MQPFYDDGQATIHCGHTLDVLPQLEAESIQCVVTSPPYWGLRKYSGEQEFAWGGNLNCEHEWDIETVVGESFNRRGRGPESNDSFQPRQSGSVTKVEHQRGTCSLCNAWRGAYGLEPTPEMYVDHTIEILRAIRRVLRPDGVVFWNIGDSYASNTKDGGRHDTDKMYPGNPDGLRAGDSFKLQHGLKTKDLCLIPFRVALAAQADGWWVRSVIIWSKPNPMPESVKDRPTESHEYILMLTKQARYYWDMDAVREPYQPTSLPRMQYPRYAQGSKGMSGQYKVVTPEYNDNHGRNIRSVWEFPTQPYPEAHFAVFPEALPEKCILAATSEKGNCSKCGKPWVRQIEKQTSGKRDIGGKLGELKATGIRNDGNIRMGEVAITTIGWQPSCTCDAAPEPAVVLDPFSGAGTTLWVAKRLGRRAVGIDVSEEYCRLAIKRNQQLSMMF